MDMLARYLRFIIALRSLNLRISTAEVMDGLEALLAVDWTSRSQVETALITTLAKDARSRRLVRQAFASYFRPPEQVAEMLAQYAAQQQEQAQQLAEAEAELVFTGPEEEWTQELQLSQEDKETYARLPEGEKQKLRDFLQQYAAGNQIVDPRGLMERVVQSQLNYWKRKLLAEEEERESRQVQLKPLETGDAELDALLSQLVVNVPEEDSLLYQDMKNIEDENLPRVTRLIQQLTRRLAVKISRRYRQSQRRRLLDLRRTIRHNIQYGGVMFRLKYRHHRLDKPRVVLICDVSGSMARYARFVLQFVYGLAGAVRDVEAFVFAEDLERITPVLKQRQGFAETMSEIMARSKVWGQGTNLAQALAQLERDYQRVLTPSTLVILLSDGKTTGLEQAAARLKKVRGRVKHILWLNTLPRKEWPLTRAPRLLGQHARLLECNTISHLEQILSRHLSFA